MNRSVRSAAVTFLVLNLLAALGFAILAFIVPALTDLDVRMRYTGLDREGVINTDALAKLHPSWGFTTEDHRISVPRHIATPALAAERENALLGLFVSGLNALFAIWLLVKTRPGAIAKEAGAAEPASPPASSPPVTPPQFDSLGGRHL